MEINFKGSHKSLTDFEWQNVPMLSIITGINGSGKSQLLELIYDTVTNNPFQRESRIDIVGNTYARGEVLLLRSEWILQNTEAINLVTLQNDIGNFYNQFTQPFNTQSNPKIDHLMVEIATKIEKERGTQVSREEFEKYFPIDYLTDNSLVTNQINKIFVDYNISRIEEIARGTKPENIAEIIGPKPWEVLNKTMKEANLPFMFNDPENTSIKASFKLEITDVSKGKSIEFGNLSSGEKVLISLVIFLYSSTESEYFPKFLLLDEPDAHLHPSMTKQFLDVISKVFVQEHGIRVIMTTHSPSTIALSPTEAIFVAHKSGPRIAKVDKDAALKILTSGVPSFSVNYENRRQIFVESQYDVMFYEKFYQKLNDFLVPEVSLTFISSGETATDKNKQKISNCTQVINITNTLRGAGNKFVWGIIDWDLTNSESDYVKVLGNGQRYSIESYILDPLLVASLLLREKMITKTDLGLSDGDSFFNLKYLETSQLQGIANFIINQIKPFVKNTSSNESESVTLLNSIQIELPIWFLRHQGHSLEEIILRAFPTLGKIKANKEEALKLAIIEKVVDDLPELVSNDFVNVFRKVQEV